MPRDSVDVARALGLAAVGVDVDADVGAVVAAAVAAVAVVVVVDGGVDGAHASDDADADDATLLPH